jgi:hypothetical protein
MKLTIKEIKKCIYESGIVRKGGKGEFKLSICRMKSVIRVSDPNMWGMIFYNEDDLDNIINFLGENGVRSEKTPLSFIGGIDYIKVILVYNN